MASAPSHSPSLTDLLGGQVQVFFAPISASIDYVRSAKLRALAVTTATPSEVMPEIPTVSNFVPGYEASFWHGLGAPKGMPAEMVDKLNKEINAGLADPKMKSRLADLGGTLLVGSPADFGKLIAEETEKWGKSGRRRSFRQYGDVTRYNLSCFQLHADRPRPGRRIHAIHCRRLRR